MAIVVAVIGAATAAIGVVGVATPATLARLAATVWGTQRGTYLAVAARLTFGIVFVLARHSVPQHRPRHRYYLDRVCRHYPDTWHRADARVRRVVCVSLSRLRSSVVRPGRGIRRFPGLCGHLTETNRPKGWRAGLARLRATRPLLILEQ